MDRKCMNSPSGSYRNSICAGMTIQVRTQLAFTEADSVGRFEDLVQEH